MEHMAKVVEVKHVSDGAVAILARCCDDEMTDSWHTLYDLENLEMHLQEHPKRVAERHSKIDAVLQRATALGHTTTRGHVVVGKCDACGRGSIGTKTHSG